MPILQVSILLYLLWLQVTNVATIVQFDYWLIFSLCLECHVVAKTSIFDLSRPITQSIKLLLFSKNLLVRKRFVGKYRSIKIVNEIWNCFQNTFTQNAPWKMLEKFLNKPLRDTELNLVELASKEPKVFCFQITKLSSNKSLKFCFVMPECQPTWICMAGLYFGMYWLLKIKRRFVRRQLYLWMIPFLECFLCW